MRDQIQLSEGVMKGVNWIQEWFTSTSDELRERVRLHHGDMVLDMTEEQTIEFAVWFTKLSLIRPPSGMTILTLVVTQGIATGRSADDPVIQRLQNMLENE